MSLLFPVLHEQVESAYERVCSVLGDNHKLIFKAMSRVMQNEGHHFSGPSSYDPVEVERKHREIKRRITASSFRGLGPAMRLMEEIWAEVISGPGLPHISNSKILDKLYFSVAEREILIRLSQDGYWVAEWNVDLRHRQLSYRRCVQIALYNNSSEEIVPHYVLQYVDAAVLAFRQGLYAVSVALLAITVEATLRDVLAPKGYNFKRSASPVDIYPYVEAEVTSTGESYVVTFSETLPKSPSEFVKSLEGKSVAKVKIRRKVARGKNQIDLHVRAPNALLDHWSKNEPHTRAQKRVNGLGEALEIARNKEGILTPDLLPEDMDDVIRTIRNNLVHLSQESLAQELELVGMTLGEFLNNSEAVYDLLTLTIPALINEQYTRLAGDNSD